jgi:hypothetical protein
MPHHFCGRPIRARLRMRHRQPGKTILIHVGRIRALFGGHGHRAVGFILDGIGDVEPVIAA